MNIEPYKGVNIFRFTRGKLTMFRCCECGYGAHTIVGVKLHITKCHDPEFNSKRWDCKREPEYHI